MNPNPEMQQPIETQENIKNSENVDASIQKEFEEISDSKKLTENMKDVFEKNEYTTGRNLSIDKKISGHKSIDLGKNPLNGPIEKYTKPILSIRGMDSNQSDIPLENRSQIIDTINSLGEFEKVKIKRCTDGSQINSEESKNFNKNEFQVVREEYIKRGGNCLSYDELLKSEEDPQNVVLGYRRAMEGIISLNLSSDQMKKVEISNVLGQNENDPKERGFDIEADYTEKVNHLVDGFTTEAIYDFLGKLELKDFSGGWQRNNDVDKNLLKSYGSTNNGGVTFMYGMVNLDLKTHLDPENPSKLYMRVMKNLSQALVSDPIMQEKVENQIKQYLGSLIHICGGKYNNGVWSAKSLTLKQYCTIKAVNDKLISSDEFSSIIKNKDTSFLENKQLESGKSLKDFVVENKVKGVGYAGVGEGKNHRYYADNVPVQERYISPKDYVLLSLYFQTKNY